MSVFVLPVLEEFAEGNLPILETELLPKLFTTTGAATLGSSV